MPQPAPADRLPHPPRIGPTAMRPPRLLRNRLSFVILSGLMAVTLAVLFAIQSHRSRARAVLDAERLTLALAAGLSDQISRTLETAAVLLADIRTRHAEGAVPALSASMASLSREMPQIRAVAVTDPAGVVRLTNAPGLAGRDLGGRGWFRALPDRAGLAPLLAPPQPGRLLEPIPADPWPPRWSLPMAIPLFLADGSFDGAAIVLLNTEYLTAVASRQAEAFDATVRLFTYDGILAARGDASLAGLGVAQPEAWPLRHFLPRREAGIHSGPDGFGRSVTGGFAVTRVAPLVVEVAQDEAVVFAGAREQDRVFLIALAAVTLLALGTVLLLARQGQRLAASEREARAASEAKQEFLASMSHEIRTPVSGVIGLSELLLEERLAPLQRRYAETINASAAHLLTLLNDFLDFSKLEAGAATPESVPFGIEEQVGTIAELFAPRAAAKGVELVCVLGPGTPARVLGDPARFRQILFNLVGNAVKFTESGWIRLSVSGSPRPGQPVCDLVCTISDTGIGIDPARIPALFDRFSQADASIRRRYGGTGLGLAISLRLAELLGGSIEAEPRPGGGSVFRLSLTLPVLAASGATPPRELAGRRALIIEEAVLHRRVLAQHLEALGLSTEEAGSVEAGLAAATRERFDLVVLGARVGAVHSTEAAEALRARGGEATRLIRFGVQDPTATPAPFGLFQAILLKPALPERVREAVLHAFRLGKPEPEVVPPEAAPRQVRVLLAEDNPVNQFMLRRMLENAGATVEVAGDGEAAVTAAASTPYDAILMDMQMPRLDGLAATRAIRTGAGPNAAARIIGLTAAVGEEHERQCLAAGMSEYMTKPVDRAMLLAKLGLG